MRCTGFWLVKLAVGVPILTVTDCPVSEIVDAVLSDNVPFSTDIDRPGRVNIESLSLPACRASFITVID